MKKETTTPYYTRFYKRHKAIIKKTAKKLKVKDAEALRRIIEASAL